MRALCATGVLHTQRPGALAQLARERAPVVLALLQHVALVDTLVREARRNVALFLERLYGARATTLLLGVLGTARLRVFAPSEASATSCFLSGLTDPERLVVVVVAAPLQQQREARYTLDRRFGPLLSALHFVTHFKAHVYAALPAWLERHPPPQDAEALPLLTFVHAHAALLDDTSPLTGLWVWFNQSRGLLQWLCTADAEP